ncbi:MAG TPA: PilZ domain-containing protein [Thermoanaerobaculia bacterium]|nr:PilZ domain-containing protein [Thermoanaerobaculia bacterium]
MVLSGRRSARRIAGEGFTARVEGVEGPVTVVNLSRMGIALETEEPLEAGQRCSLELSGPAGVEHVDFYVVRCEQRGADGRATFLTAGLFVEKLRRRDLPKVVHQAFG